MLAQPGRKITDLTFFNADGQPIRLSEIVTQPTLLVFLRHLA